MSTVLNNKVTVAKVNFSSLVKGDTFLRSVEGVDRVCKVINPVSYRGAVYNAVNIQNGGLSNRADDDLVIKVDAEITVK